MNLFFNKKGEMDIDNGYDRGDRYGGEIGIMYCDSIDFNKGLVENNLPNLYRQCDISEFVSEKCNKTYCNQNKFLIVQW